MKKSEAARGLARLSDIAALPIIDIAAEIRYEGSISKTGDNADWDWGMYTDENGEWVLMEADGPGCIYNFTQHRYPTSKVPVFKFYFDNSDTPQFEITPEEFGKKPPFIKPFADKFVGPEDNGRGPIWVVRSFVPMEFCTHCKVTSSIKLEGAEKDKGQGGWGHITYQLYDSRKGLNTFSDTLDISDAPYDFTNNSVFENCSSVKDEFKLSNNATHEVFSRDKGGVISRVSLEISGFKPDYLSQLWLEFTFDGEKRVRAPIGTFFGCEYANTPAKLKTALLTCDFKDENAFFLNSFPMPFFDNCSVCAVFTGQDEISVSSSVDYTPDMPYERGSIGYFTSSEYYPKTDNIIGKNSVIADISGHGQMVYGVISGEDIACGCEGDVRVFIDGIRSPAVESDGSESWGSYGWGFVCPPQCNPYSAYNGVPDINDTWSELRLCFTDSYPFKSRIRFELEHGCQNDGGGKHSGQIFCYMKPDVIEEHITTVDFSESPNSLTVKDRFENGIHNNYDTFNMRKAKCPFTVELDLPIENKGVVIKRVSLQKKNKMLAEVYVNGVPIEERKWFFADSNEFFSLLEDSFSVPGKYTSGKKRVTVTIKPLSDAWNECRYKFFALGE